MLQKKIKTITFTEAELWLLNKLVDPQNTFVSGLSIIQLKNKLQKAYDETQKKDSSEAF